MYPIVLNEFLIDNIIIKKCSCALREVKKNSFSNEYTDTARSQDFLILS